MQKLRRGFTTLAMCVLPVLVAGGGLMGCTLPATSSRSGSMPAKAQKPPFEKDPLILPLELREEDRVIYTKAWLVRERYRKASFDAAWIKLELLSAEIDIAGSGLSLRAVNELLARERQQLIALESAAQQAKRDFELFEIDIRTKYDGQIPRWWRAIRIDRRGWDLFL